MADTRELTVERRYGPGAAARFRKDGSWHDDSLTLWLDKWADEDPRRRAITDGTNDLDYGTLRDRAYAFARWLKAEGVRPGDRVAMQLPNWSEFLVAYLAITRIGAITVPIMPVYRHNEVLHVLRSSGAVVAVTTGVFRGFDHGAMFRELQRESPTLRKLVLVREPARDHEVTLEDVIAKNENAAGALGSHPDADAGHVIVYTSGTESTAKGGFHTWNTLAFSARALAHDIFKMTPADTVFMPSPISHSTGIVVGLVAPILTGAASHVQEIWEPTEGLRRIEKYRCSITATATPFVVGALDAAAKGSFDLSSMRAWLCAGAPIPSELARAFEATFTKARLLPLFGCTEVLAATVCRLGDTIETISASDGKPVNDAVTIKLVDESGKEVAQGQTGEITYRGPGAILGYFGEPEKTAAAIDADGFHHCGDLGFVNANGYLRVAGRVKDIIIRGGQNLSAREIEEHLSAHPSVREVAVVAYPDAKLGEKVCAFVAVKLDATVTLESLREFLLNERRVAVQKAPEKLVLIDRLPLTATGKVQKYMLRKQAAEDAR